MKFEVVGKNGFAPTDIGYAEKTNKVLWSDVRGGVVCKV